MQGGDLCENAPGLRLNNVGIAALIAPKPLLMVSATGDKYAEKNADIQELQKMLALWGRALPSNAISYDQLSRSGGSVKV